MIEADSENRRIVLSVIDIPSHRDRADLDEEEGARDTAESEPPTQMADALAEARPDLVGEEPEDQERE